MEELNLENLSLFLTDEMVVIPEELQQISLSQKFKNNSALVLDQDKLEAAEPKPTSPTPSIKPTEILQQVKGNFEKGIVVIHEGKELEHDHQEFLMKILGAVNCGLKDIALIGADAVEELPEESLKVLNPNKVIVFGLVHHEIMNQKQGTYRISGSEQEVLFADDIKDIFENVNLKKQLWASLQVLFHIKK